MVSLSRLGWSLFLQPQQIALDSFGVFIHQVQAAEVELRTKVLKVVFDLLLQHGIGFLAEKGHGVHTLWIQPEECLRSIDVFFFVRSDSHLAAWQGYRISVVFFGPGLKGGSSYGCCWYLQTHAFGYHYEFGGELPLILICRWWWASCSYNEIIRFGFVEIGLHIGATNARLGLLLSWDVWQSTFTTMPQLFFTRVLLLLFSQSATHAICEWLDIL